MLNEIKQHIKKRKISKFHTKDGIYSTNKISLNSKAAEQGLTVIQLKTKIRNS